MQNALFVLRSSFRVLRSPHYFFSAGAAAPAAAASSSSFFLPITSGSADVAASGPEDPAIATIVARWPLRELVTRSRALTVQVDRERALYGAWLCGSCLGATTMGLHHKLCHVLGGTFGLPHAETHTVVLPYALAYNAPAVPLTASVVARALDADDAPRALWDLARRLGAPLSLAELGLEEGDLATAAAQAVSQAYANPRPVTEDGVLALLRAAYEGTPPA